LLLLFPFPPHLPLPAILLHNILVGCSPGALAAHHSHHRERTRERQPRSPAQANRTAFDTIR
jgi:hypothetical protein